MESLFINLLYIMLVQVIVVTVVMGIEDARGLILVRLGCDRVRVRVMCGLVECCFRYLFCSTPIYCSIMSPYCLYFTSYHPNEYKHPSHTPPHKTPQPKIIFSHPFPPTSLPLFHSAHADSLPRQ